MCDGSKKQVQTERILSAGRNVHNDEVVEIEQVTV
jgi:hypothetical protein